MPLNMPSYYGKKTKKTKKKAKSVASYAISQKAVKKPTPSPSAAVSAFTISTEKDYDRDLTKGLASAALAFPGKGTASKVIRGALAGAAIGGDIGRALGARKKKKGKAATTTVSESATTQKSKFHVKDPSKTKRV